VLINADASPNAVGTKAAATTMQHRDGAATQKSANVVEQTATQATQPLELRGLLW